MVVDSIDPPTSLRSVASIGLRILVISGPNLDRLGSRQPEIYGTTTLAEIHAMLVEKARTLGAEVECVQSSHEGEIVERVNSSSLHGFVGVVMNAGAYSHTSIAILDAIHASGLPCVEVHLSNPEAREPFRHESRIASACVGKVTGFGARSYVLGFEALVGWIRDRE